MPRPVFTDIHCHLIPEIDDGAKSLDEALAMAEIAVADGITTSIVTPHQLAAFSHNLAADIRIRTTEFQQALEERGIPLRVLAGADVRIEEDLISKLRNDQVLTLADRGRHVLLELPHELYFPLEPVLNQLRAAGMVGILSHPERNQGLLRRPQLVESLVEYGCLMQVTAGSLLGTFGPACQQMAESLLKKGLVHFLASDAHGSKARRPLMSQAHGRAAELVGSRVADQICCANPAAVAEGEEVAFGKFAPAKESGWTGWLRKRAA